ncbi:BRO family protein, partial [Acinetobacter baumannii]|nr:BRO family protein [Acinetobacter baumannii]
MNNVSVFNFNQKEVRTIVKKDGEIWFVLSDVCNVLEIGNVSMAASRLDAEEITLSTIEGSHRPTNLVNESGLYSLVLTSRKPEAKQFKKWVTSDVLPSIRKNGGYISGQENDDPEIIMAKA